jgi:hypothetical protein
MLTVKAKWVSFIIHSLQIAFGCRRLHSEISLGCVGIEKWDTGSIFKKLSAIE